MIGWAYHSELNVHNNASTTLPIGYTAGYVLDTASLISLNRLQPDCDDLRVTYGVDPAETELDRLVEGCNTASTTVRFSTQAAVPVGGDDHNYHLYYGNELAGAAPADPGTVFAFFDDFQDGNADGWNPAKGTWGVVDDGGNFIYRYTGGGANWALSYVPLAGVSDLDYIARVRASASTNWIGLAFRIQDPNNFLNFYESKDVNLFKLARIVNDNHVINPSTPAYVMDANSWYWLRLQALGNTVRARIWLDGVSEPSTWMINSTETMYQAQTNIGATLYYHTTNADWDDIQVRKLVATEPTVEIYVPVPTITVTADPGQSKVIGTADPVFTYTSSESGITFTGALSRVAGENVGSYAITQGTLSASGYNIIFVPADFTITPKPITTWYYRAQIDVTNTSASATLPVRYTAGLVLDTSALINSGRMLATCEDLQLGSVQGADVFEIDRVVENCNTTNYPGLVCSATTNFT